MRSEETAVFRRQRYIETLMRDTSNACLQSWLHEILFKIQSNIQFVSKDQRPFICNRKQWNSLAYWSFRSDDRWQRSIQLTCNHAPPGIPPGIGIFFLGGLTLSWGGRGGTAIYRLKTMCAVKGIASPQTSFGVRLSRIHFSPTEGMAFKQFTLG